MHGWMREHAPACRCDVVDPDDSDGRGKEVAQGQGWMHGWMRGHAPACRCDVKDPDDKYDACRCLKSGFGER